jgi:hypothetical protein
LAGVVKELEKYIVSANCVKDSQIGHVSIDFSETFTKLSKTRENLILIKSRIAEASAPIQAKLIEIAEAKSLITFFQSIVIKEGVFPETVGFGVNASSRDVTYHNYIDSKSRAETIKQSEDKIDTLQDEIDTFNASTKIDWE